jgi:hypothetical protein
MEEHYKPQAASEFKCSSEPRFKTNEKLWMKDTDGFHTILVWVVEREYNENRGGWDYEVRQKDVAQKDWLGDSYWRAEKDLIRA